MSLRADRRRLLEFIERMTAPHLPETPHQAAIAPWGMRLQQEERRKGAKLPKAA
jgi:hypothetical protein